MASSESKLVAIILKIKKALELQDNNNKQIESNFKILFDMVKALEDRILVLELYKDVKSNS